MASVMLSKTRFSVVMTVVGMVVVDVDVDEASVMFSTIRGVKVDVDIVVLLELLDDDVMLMVELGELDSVMIASLVNRPVDDGTLGLLLGMDVDSLVLVLELELELLRVETGSVTVTLAIT